MSITATKSAESTFLVRKYRPEDRVKIRALCADTGFLGTPVDQVFEDRELFADYLTKYYTDYEPESAFVLELNGEVRGYLLGSRKYDAQARFNAWHNGRLFFIGMWRYFFKPYKKATRQYVHWLLTRASKEATTTPKKMAHFHINMYPEAKKVATTRALVDAYLSYLSECGEKAVFGQMVTFEGRRTERMFERYGFKLIDKKRVTKFDEVQSEPIFLCTVIKNLEERVHLYDKKSEDLKASQPTAPSADLS
ncbi:MAG: GNAT family acetyltransferase [Verrucomicrobiota bacterium]|nr:GNAT family acetyltransferase [Verrucomicrobiota bacterium]